MALWNDLISGGQKTLSSFFSPQIGTFSNAPNWSQPSYSNQRSTLTNPGPAAMKPPPATQSFGGPPAVKPTGTLSGPTPTPIPTGGNPPPNPMAGAEDSARSAAQAELESAMSENEYVQNTLTQQSGQLETDRTRALSGLETDRTRAQTEAQTAKTEATQATQTAQNKALSTAQDIQKKNRNVLRALGILSSSAGGEMLTKPMTEYGSQSAELQQGLVDRLGKVEQWWMDRSKDFDVSKQDVEQKYADLKEKISNDLRFNAQQRGLAIKAGTAALNERLRDINTQKIAYQTAAQQYNNSLLLQLAQIKMYNNPTADVSAIYNTLLSTAQGGTQPQQVGIQQTEEQKKKLLGSAL